MVVARLASRYLVPLPGQLVGVADRGVGPERGHPELGVALPGAHRQQLGDRRRRHRVAAGQRQQRRAHVEHLGGVALGDQLAGAVLRDLVELPVANELDELVEVGQERRLAAADRHPLGGQRVAADLPAPVDLAEHQLVGHEHVIDEHGVEHRAAGELAQRLHVHALAAHVQQEVGDAVDVLARSGRSWPAARPTARTGPRWSRSSVR